MPATPRARAPRHLLPLALLPALALCGCREAGAAAYVGVSAVAANVGTRYAPGYSEEAFRQVAVGQSLEDVRTRLGEPLRTWTDGPHQYWRYSDSPSGGDYWVRLVVFDETGRVSRVEAELYVD